MKQLLVFVLGFISMTLTGCDSEDNSIPRAGKYGEGVVGQVRGGVAYDGYARQAVDESDPVSVFFGKELHSPCWDGYGNEVKTFFEQGEWNDESCLMINSQEEFQAAYMGIEKLPEVNFGQYTLVIGRTWSSACEFDGTALRDLDLNYELEIQLLHNVNWTSVAGIQIIYYWRLYPKLEQKPIILKRTVTEVSD